MKILMFESFSSGKADYKSLLKELSYCKPEDKSKTIEVLKKVFVEVDDISLLTQSKNFIENYCGWYIDSNMGNQYFKIKQGFAYYKDKDILTRWGVWEQIEDHGGNYCHLWDYKVTLTKFVDIINSLPEIFKITIKKPKIVFNDIDPYGEEEWD